MRKEIVKLRPYLQRETKTGQLEIETKIQKRLERNSNCQTKESRKSRERKMLMHNLCEWDRCLCGWCMHNKDMCISLSIACVSFHSFHFRLFLSSSARCSRCYEFLTPNTHTNDAKFEKRQIRHDTFISRSMRYVSTHRIVSSSLSLNSTVSPLHFLYFYAFDVSHRCVHGECARNPIHMRFEQNRERGQRTNERVKKKKEKILFFLSIGGVLLCCLVSRTFIVYFSLSRFVKIGRQAWDNIDVSTMNARREREKMYTALWHIRCVDMIVCVVNIHSYLV